MGYSATGLRYTCVPFYTDIIGDANIVEYCLRRQSFKLPLLVMYMASAT